MLEKILLYVENTFLDVIRYILHKTRTKVYQEFSNKHYCNLTLNHRMARYWKMYS